jgi:ABC-type antimicrobial peptide transport system permease subunit
VLDWKEINPEIVQFIESDRAGGMVMITVLYIIIGFGIFGTVIMMVTERKRELAVMISIGMQKIRLYLILFYETIFIGIIGVASGFLLSIPIIKLLENNPVKLPSELADTYLKYGFEPYFFFGATPSVFINQILIVFTITVIISFYPILKVKKLNVTTALRG